MLSPRLFLPGDRVVRGEAYLDVLDHPKDRPLSRPIGVVVEPVDVEGNVAVRWSVNDVARLVRADDLELAPVVVCPEVNSSRSPKRNGASSGQRIF